MLMKSVGFAGLVALATAQSSEEDVTITVTGIETITTQCGSGAETLTVTGSDGEVTVTEIDWVTETACSATGDASHGPDGQASHSAPSGGEAHGTNTDVPPSDGANTVGLGVTVFLAGAMALFL